MDNFALTKGGREFLYGTMPAIAKNLSELTKAVNNLNSTIETTSVSGNTVTVSEEQITAIKNAYICNREVVKNMSNPDVADAAEYNLNKGYGFGIKAVCEILGISLTS